MLDWGLGHTTRCIPLLKELSKPPFRLIIAGSKSQKVILEQELSRFEFQSLSGYNIHFSNRSSMLPFSILLQIPAILKTIINERRWVKRFIKTTKTDIIISDNRPGFWSNRVHSIYITHQLTVKTGNVITQKIATVLHQRYIKRFDACWVPDTNQHCLSGVLSLSKIRYQKISFIGPLSRFKNIVTDKKFDISFILSGPEPQRTAFENIIVKQLQGYNGHFCLVRGLPSHDTGKDLHPGNLLVFNHLNAKQLNTLVSQSTFVVCRSGYTSVMDLIKAGAKALLVPTPHQGEQEYLARYLSEKNIFPTISQQSFSVAQALEVVKIYRFKTLEISFDTYKTFVNDLEDVFSTASKTNTNNATIT